MTSEVSGDPKSDKMSVDPFSNEVFLSRADYVKAALGTVLLIPLRAVAILVVLGVAWVTQFINEDLPALGNPTSPISAIVLSTSR